MEKVSEAQGRLKATGGVPFRWSLGGGLIVSSVFPFLVASTQSTV